MAGWAAGEADNGMLWVGVVLTCYKKEDLRRTL